MNQIAVDALEEIARRECLRQREQWGASECPYLDQRRLCASCLARQALRQVRAERLNAAGLDGQPRNP